MRMPPLPADSIHARACKLKCEKILTRPGNEELPTSPGFCKDYFVINDFEKQLISVVKIQCIPHPFCNMDLPITKHS